MKNIFELNYCEFDFMEDFEDIKFFDGRHGISVVDFTDFIENTKEHNEKYKTITPTMIFKHCEDAFTEFIEDLSHWYKEDDQSFEDFKTDFLESGHEDFTAEFEDFIFSELENNVLTDLLNEIGIKFGTTGYSPFAYYLALGDYKDDFIDDLYSGNNWYKISQYDESGNVIESLHGLYLLETSDLINAVEDYFLIEDDFIYLVDNDYSSYFEDEKIKKVETYYEKRFAL